MPTRRPLGTIVGGAVLIASLLFCGVGTGVLIGPAIRATQDIQGASQITGVGVTIFDMHEGDDYWIYQPAEASWPESITCNVSSSPRDTFLVRRAARPLTAPARITHWDVREGDDKARDYDFTYYGTLRGDRTEASLMVDCPPTTFLVVPSRAPQRYLVVVLVAGTFVGLVGVAVVITGLVRRRRVRRTLAPAVQPHPGMPLPPSTPVPPGPLASGTVASGTVAPAPSPGGPSRRWYLAVIPLVLVAVCGCGVGGIASAALGFWDTFDAPDLGPERSGVVETVMTTTTEYALYADQAGEIPDKHDCVLFEEKAPQLFSWRTGRPLGDPETIEVNGHRYKYVGTFRTHDIIIGRFECGDRSSLLVRPSRRSWPFVWGAVALATMTLGAAAAIGLTTAVQRRRASAGRSTTTAVPSGHTHV